MSYSTQIRLSIKGQAFNLLARGLKEVPIIEDIVSYSTQIRLSIKGHAFNLLARGFKEVPKVRCSTCNIPCSNSLSIIY